MEVSYRKIAKVLAQGMPVDGQEYSDIIEGYIKTIEAMPAEQRAALGASYIFSSKAPKEERQELFQELVACTLTELGKYDGIKDVEGFCYTVAKHNWASWWRMKKRRNQILNGGFVSLNEQLPTSGTEFESKLISELDCQTVLNTLPPRVRAIVNKRLETCERISHSESNFKWRYVKQNEGAIRDLLTV